MHWFVLAMDEAEYVRLRTLLDSMTCSTEKGETIKDFLHALRAVIKAIEKRSSCKRKELEASILPKVYRVVEIEHEPTGISLLSHRVTMKEINQFLDSMRQ